MISQKNATWQGQIIWLEENETVRFRSMLELIKLIDGVIGGGELSVENGEDSGVI